MSRAFEGKARQTTRSVARRAMLRGRSIVNITVDVRKYAAEQKDMEEPSAARWTIRRIAREGEAQRSQKSKEFVEKCAEVYAKT